MKEVDERIRQINLPDTFARNPRSILERKFWKGEYQLRIHKANFLYKTIQQVNGSLLCSLLFRWY